MLDTPSANVADLLTIQAKIRPDAMAVISPHGSLSFFQLEQRVVSAVSHLVEQGIRTCEVVGLCCLSEKTLTILMLAAAHLGTPIISIPTHLPRRIRDSLLAKAGARWLVTDGPLTPADGIPLVTINLHTISRAPVGRDFPEVNPDGTWLIVEGSGSTGEPKLIPISHRQQIARCRPVATWLGITEIDRIAVCSHLDYSSTKTRLLEGLMNGAAFVIAGKLPGGDTVAWWRAAHVSVLHATAFHLASYLSAVKEEDPPALEFLRILSVGSSTVSGALRERASARLCPRLHVHYGTNEAGVVTFAGPPDTCTVPGTVGRALPEIELAICDSRSTAVSTGTIGHILVRSAGIAKGYLANPEATAGAFADGWFDAGDLGSLTATGQLIYGGRSDDLMIMNGINIYPAEIERAISQHVAVRDVAAMPLPSPIHQNIPVCAVTLQAGASVTEKELLDFARQHLGAHSPRRIFILESIPRSQQGKLIRTELRKIIGNSLRPKRNPVPLQTVPFKLRQPARQMRIPLSFSVPIDLDSIDDWLTSALEIMIDSCNYPIPPLQQPEHKRMANLTWRILLLMRSLLQAARIPVFDPGCILKIDPDKQHPSTWMATLAVANIEHIPPRCYSIAIDEAIKIVQWMMGKPRTPENAETLFQSMLKKTIHPLQRMVTAGKSTLPVLRAVYAQDIPFTHLGAGVYQLGWGSKSRRMDRSTTEMDSAIGSKLAQNKIWSANLIRRAGLPAPRHAVVATSEEAMRVAHRLGWPVVIKPVDRDRGEGVTVGVKDDTQLQAAFKMAQRMSRARQVIIEREVCGVCHRLFIANGQLLYAVKRLPKSIHGDGRQTLVELIRAANESESRRPSWLRTERHPDDALALEAMAAADFTLDSVPAAGARVPLRNIESTAQGGFDEDVTDGIHPDNLDIAIRAAALFDLHVAGIDIITPDIGQPWHANGAIINEVNFAPLFGGGEISRSHIPKFLAQFMNGDGRIPIEVVVGGDSALDMARVKQQELVSQQVDCFVTSHETTFAPAGEIMPFPFVSLYQRCKALLMDRRVGAIVLVIQTDELLQTGIPVDRIDRIEIIGSTLKQSRSRGALESLLALLRLHANHP